MPDTPPAGIGAVPAGERLWDRAFRGLAYGFAGLVLLLTAAILVNIGRAAWPAVDARGFDFLTGSAWNALEDDYGILPEVWGTLYSSTLAILLGGLLGLSVAIFLSERMLSTWLYGVLRRLGAKHSPFFRGLPDRVESALRNLVELLAAIPSVVYGIWGIFVLIPLLQPPAAWLHENFGWFPLFSTPFGARGMLPAALVLAIMILPTVSALSRDALAGVPPKLKEASYGLGATRWETLFRVTLPTALPGLSAAIVLAFGRALGETMALVMLLGNVNEVSASLFSPGRTLASLLAEKYSEATGDRVGVLMYVGLTLLAVTMVVNVIGAVILGRATRTPGVAK